MVVVQQQQLKDEIFKIDKKTGHGACVYNNIIFYNISCIYTIYYERILFFFVFTLEKKHQKSIFYAYARIYSKPLCMTVHFFTTRLCHMWWWFVERCEAVKGGGGLFSPHCFFAALAHQVPNEKNINLTLYKATYTCKLSTSAIYALLPQYAVPRNKTFNYGCTTLGKQHHRHVYIYCCLLFSLKPRLVPMLMLHAYTLRHFQVYMCTHFTLIRHKNHVFIRFVKN